MKLPQRSYYYKEKENSSDTTLESRIGDICLKFPGYGYRRVTKQLHREGWRVNHKKVSRIMREKGWTCRPRKKKWITTTNSNHDFTIYPNLLKDLAIRAINQVWVADITYIHILTCFVYLATILDAYSRKAIGYALSRHIDTNLTLNALRRAIDERKPHQGCIHIQIAVFNMPLVSMSKSLRSMGFRSA